MAEKGKFYYRYSEYITTWLLSLCCCCMFDRESTWWRKRKFEYDRYEKAVDKLNKQIDIVKFVEKQRLSEFMARLFLKPYQRALVQSFQEYQIDNMPAFEEQAKRIEAAQERLDNFILVTDENRYDHVDENELTEK